MKGVNRSEVLHQTGQPMVVGQTEACQSDEQRFTMHTARLGGVAGIFTDPIHIPVNYENVGVVE